MTRQILVVLGAFLASAVEMVEALTIVLAVGMTRGWRSVAVGVGAAFVALAALIAALGPALTEIPISALRIVVGAVLLTFGLQWLRKAILRTSGLKAMHDEDEAFAEATAAGRSAEGDMRAGLDWVGFVVSFKGVLLEGLEVIFIVITFGLNAHSMPTAIAGAAVGGAIVLVAGIVLHRPLARVPENTIKFAVGLLLSTFGTFWSVEGLGVFAPGSGTVEWPGGEVALLGVLAAWCLLSWVAVRLLSPYGRRQQLLRPRISEEAA